MGGLASGGGGGIVAFFDTSTAGNATIINNGGVVGGCVQWDTEFSDDSSGGTSRIELFGNGSLDISFHNAPGVTMGSIEGTGKRVLGR